MTDRDDNCNGRIVLGRESCQGLPHAVDLLDQVELSHKSDASWAAHAYCFLCPLEFYNEVSNKFEGFHAF